MANGEPMTRLELIRLIGNVIIEVDVLRSRFERNEDNRKTLDNLRDELDTSQRRLVRSELDESTQEFKVHTGSLRASNVKLKETIEEMQSVAQTLQSLTDLVKIIQKIIGFTA